jgi:hypothetical protein
MPRKLVWHLDQLALVTIVLLGLSCSSDNEPIESSPAPRFSPPQLVEIQGYEDHAMEPFLSRDGTILMFNDLNQDQLDGQPHDTDLHWAIRLDDSHFRYQGPIEGAASDELPHVNELEGVASMDAAGTFVFVSAIGATTPGDPRYLCLLRSAPFHEGSLGSESVLPRLLLSPDETPENINFDAELQADGRTLYFTEGRFAGQPWPDTADIGLALRGEDGPFFVPVGTKEKMAAINTAALEYAACGSRDGRELFFSRAQGSAENGFRFSLLLARREEASQPWGSIQLIADGGSDVLEAPALSPDGRLLYYHRPHQGVFHIWVCTRL